MPLAALSDQLPIIRVLPEIQTALARRQSVIVSAPTGSGKTTAVAPALLAEAWLDGRKILLLEPRRLAARLAAKFMAENLGEQVGETVGYQVRFDRCISAATRIKVMTEGVLVRRMQNDPELDGIGLIIFDEFHERSLEGDLALALALDIRAGLRDDLRLLVMSATLAGERLASLLPDGQIITGHGRSYPVENRYLPPAPELDSPRPDHIARMTTRAVRHALTEEKGDLLVFLPGRGEISRVMRLLAGQQDNQVVIQPLHGGMRLADQAAAVLPDPQGRRRIILSTTIAETSLTIEGITTVVDCGWKRVPRFDPASALTRLDTVRISRAAADQRSGRAGRLGPGTCYRLWNRGVEQGLQPFDRPEILQADLTALILELALWGVVDPGSLHWLDPPDDAAVQQARQLLTDLQAIDNNGRITSRGKAMAELPVQPRLAHMLLQAGDEQNRPHACTIAALISEPDILRGDGHSVDLDDRLHALSRFQKHGARVAGIDVRRCQRVLRISRQLQDLLHRQPAPPSPVILSPGALLSLAYPDRIAGLRPDTTHSYKLVSGRGAMLPRHDRLQATPFLTIAAMDGRRAEGRIYLAAALKKEELQSLHGHRFIREERVFFDVEAKAVRGEVITRINKLAIAGKPLAGPDPLLVRKALLAAIGKKQLPLPWSRKATNLVRRIRLLASLNNQLTWPDFSEAALLATVEEWLTPYLDGIKNISGIQALNLEQILLHRLDWSQQKRLEQEAPSHLRVPSGSKVPLQYQEDGPPILAVRLQEMFGLPDTPTICRGRIRVLLHLLSPAQRPVQITDDLKGFWESSYHEVKKELKGRYPKHYWPDDPLNALPTSRVKPRKK